MVVDVGVDGVDAAVVVVLVMVIVFALLAAGEFRALLLGQLDGGGAHERIRAEDDRAADRLTGLGMLLQRGVLDRLENFVAPHGLSRTRQGFVDVSDHGG